MPGPLSQSINLSLSLMSSSQVNSHKIKHTKLIHVSTCRPSEIDGTYTWKFVHNPNCYIIGLSLYPTPSKQEVDRSRRRVGRKKKKEKQREKIAIIIND